MTPRTPHKCLSIAPSVAVTTLDLFFVSPKASPMTYRAPYPDVAIPDKVSVPDFVLRTIENFGDRIALLEHVSGAALTYRQVATQARCVAHSLQLRGLNKGDVVAIYAPNVPHYPVAMLGVALAGGVVTTVSPLYTVHELQHQLAHNGAQYMITVSGLLPTVLATKHKFREVFTWGGSCEATPFAELLDSDGEPQRVAIDPKEDLIVLPYSSGTTSLPKGVCLTHYNIISNLCQYDVTDFNALTEEDTILGLLPFFHIYGMVIVMLGGLLRGVRIITMQRFEPEVFLQAMQEHRITMAYVAPPVIHFLAKHPAVDNYDLSHLRDLFSGAAPLGLELAQACVQRLKCSLRQGYGMTEMSPVSHVLPYVVKHKHSSIGRLVPNMTLKIVSTETGQPVPPGELGEFWLKGPNVMKGYLNNAEATAQTIDADGYLHTGDLGYIDEDGDCYVVDRCKELIKVKGYQVAPAELEDLLNSHPAVEDCAVVGVFVDGEETPKAFVVLKPAHQPSPKLAADIIAFAAARSAPYKRIKQLDFIKAIPKSASGKILRRELRSQTSKL